MSPTQQLTIAQALSRAKEAAKQGNLAVAQQLYEAVLQHQPNHPIATKGLRKLSKGSPHDPSVQVQTANPSPDQINTLINLYRTGQMTKTEQACRELLHTHPQSLTVLNIFGAVLAGQGQLQQAVQVFDEMIQLKPNLAEVYINRGVALKKLGQLEVAVASYDQAIQLKPDYAEAHCNRGNALTELGQLEAAVASYENVIQLKPDYVEAYCNRGKALTELGQLEAAVDSYEQAIQLRPNLAEAYSNRGDALTDLGRLEAAVASYDQAIRLKPDYAQAYSNRGITLTDLGQLDGARASYDQAIQLQPDLAEAYSNRGNVLTSLGQLEKAVASCNQAIQIQPDYAQAYCNRGVALKELGQLEEAVASYDQAIRLKPDYAEAYSNRGNTLVELGQLEEAMASYDQAIQIQPDYAQAYSNLLFNLQYQTDFDPEFYLSQAQKFRLNCQPQRTTPSSYTYQKNPTKLKIGLVSSDFGNHPGGYFSLSTLRELSQKDLELIAYSNYDRSDQLAPQLRPLFSQWHSIQQQSDQDVVAQIVKDGIHILIDLQGHTGRNRLPVFLYQPAPVQASWLSPGSTGMDEIDYYIGSSYLIPEGEEKHFVEQVLRLPETEACFTPPDLELPVNDLPAERNNFITFGCFNKLIKMNDRVVALWGRILSAVPNSKLFLKSWVLSNQKMVAHTQQRFKHYDIDPSRLTLQGWSTSRKESLQAYHQVDIALDPFPFQGHTTTCEAVWMGVPVLVLKGDRFLFHAGENVNYNLGMDDWVAENQDQYLSQAIRFSSDLDRLATIRRGLRQQALKSPLFDAPRFADHFSRILWQMWSKSNPDNNRKLEE